MGVEIYDSTTQGNKISNFELEVGSSKNLYAVVTSTGMADQSVKWTSNNPNIVDVDENGVVTARTVERRIGSGADDTLIAAG